MEPEVVKVVSELDEFYAGAPCVLDVLLVGQLITCRSHAAKWSIVECFEQLAIVSGFVPFFYGPLSGMFSRFFEANVVLLPIGPGLLMSLGCRLQMITTHDRRHIWQAQQVRAALL